jgi:hypothetical protein
MTSVHPRFPTKLRFLEQPGSFGTADRSERRQLFPRLDHFTNLPPFPSANAWSYGGGYLPSYSATVGAAFTYTRRWDESFLGSSMERRRGVPWGDASEPSGDTSR